MIRWTESGKTYRAWIDKNTECAEGVRPDGVFCVF